MKTAMQTLISKLKTEISELNKKIDKYSNDTGVYTGHKYGLDQALSVAESLLEMEKEQMIEAFTEGNIFGADYFDGVNITAENYYNQTFKIEQDGKWK